MTAESLKKSILQQAIQGKLVPQNPDDEPASLLLDRIRAEKARLVAEGKIKRDKNESVIYRNPDGQYIERIGKTEKDISEEIPFEIPESWEWVRIYSIANSSLGKTIDRLKQKGKEVPYLCSINVYFEGVNLSTIKRFLLEEDEIERYKLQNGDLLLCEGGDCGRCAVWDKDLEMYYQNALHRVRFYGNVLSKFYKFVFELFKLTKYVEGRGQTIKHFTYNNMKGLFFPLPPLAEQKRIVAKIEELMPMVEEYGRAQSRLDELNSSLGDNIRKSVLQYAIQGKLVPQDPDDEPASALLDRIRAEKARLVAEGKIKRDKNESVIYRNPDGQYIERIGKTETDITDQIPFEIPDSWEWVRVKTVGFCETGTTPSKGHPEFFGDYIPFLGPANMLNNQIISVTQGLSFEGSKFGRIVPKDTILQVCIGGSIGKCAIVDKNVTFNQQINSVTPIFANVKYIFDCLQSNNFIQQIKLKATGTATPIINRGNWEQLLIPLPPLAEQKRIVDRINEILSFFNTNF